ncbi:enoyl-CoA hydratase-related protein [Pseudonocardia sp. GCM10023141]|uniref:enoyl-CoA hydratase-related protein n=1 Tax=Pseudonocardia sp. GCM10023141 TaxID=3252653 RepID=UPI0036188029
MSYRDILIATDGPVRTITINRPDAGNKIRPETAHELIAAFQDFRTDPALRAAVLTGAGTKFFCIGGEHDELASLDYSAILPMVDLYQIIDTTSKPVIAAVNGYAVGGGNVLHTVCDLTVAAETAVFRQVGPMVGSFDAGYGTAYLEDTIGRKRAKEMWYLNRKYTASQALGFGLVNEVMPDSELLDRAAALAREIATRSPLAIGGLKAAFSARHNGVSGQARIAHDQLLTLYLATAEAREVSAAFTERRTPEEGTFWS